MATWWHEFHRRAREAALAIEGPVVAPEWLKRVMPDPDPVWVAELDAAVVEAKDRLRSGTATITAVTREAGTVTLNEKGTR